ncbi:hypothetical protein [Acetobacter sicerae]|uniref:hypothetical protein n=1 Tax=Acetobacter sicerae TaxID=85325 RepID=UPI001E30B801|nr:hypothetical protein [Acetobacter sicerae]
MSRPARPAVDQGLLLIAQSVSGCKGGGISLPGIRRDQVRPTGVSQTFNRDDTAHHPVIMEHGSETWAGLAASSSRGCQPRATTFCCPVIFPSHGRHCFTCRQIAPD